MEFVFPRNLQVDSLQLTFLHKYFPRFLLRFVVFYKRFANILGTSIFQSIYNQPLLAFVVASKYSFPKKLQHIFRAGDYSLRKTKMRNVSNGKLIVLKSENIYVLLNIKYTAIICSKTRPTSLLYVEQKHIENSIKRHNIELF